MRNEMRLPDFIAVGPPRTGTTWIDRVLRGHVGLPTRTKETQFFNWRYESGIEWYAAHFKGCASDLPAGEIAPIYFASEQARQRIKRHIPDCRIICTFRDPVERLYSHYRLWRKIGAASGPFEKVSETHDVLLSFNRYATHLEAWRKLFGPDRVLAAIYEDSKIDRQGYVDRICDFIGVGRIDLATIPWESERVHHAAEAPKNTRLALFTIQLQSRMERRRLYRLIALCSPVFDFCRRRGTPFEAIDPELEAKLRVKFRPEVEKLEAMLQRDLSAWYEPGRIRADAGSIEGQKAVPWMRLVRSWSKSVPPRR
jgi:sulfotransferase family protein